MATRNGKEIVTALEAEDIQAEAIKETGLPDAATIQETEYDLLEGLMKAAEYREDEELREKLQIRRNGKKLFEFTIRPLSEGEIQACRKQATIYMKNPAGKHLPRIEKEVDYVALRCHKIYTATIEEDRKKIWDNPAMKEKFNIIKGAEMVDLLLTGGEKSAVNDKIDTLSGYDLDLDEYAKN